MKTSLLLLTLGLTLAGTEMSALAEVEIEGAIRNDILVRRQTDGPAAGRIRDQMDSSESYLRLSTELSEHVRIAVSLELNRALRENGKWSEQESVRINELLKEASIELHDMGGVPVAFVIGKHEIAFGQAVAAMPSYTKSGLYGTQSVDRVMGLTVRLDERILGIIQSVEASIFSSQVDAPLSRGGTGRIDSASVRIRGEILEGLQFSASAMHLGNKHLGDGSAEQRYSVGLIYTDRSGNWMAWVEGLYHADQNNPNYGQNAHFGITAGVSRRAGPGDVVAEITWIQNVMTELGLGYRVYVTRNITVGPEIRFTRWDSPVAGSRNDLRLGIAVEVLLGTAAASPDDQVIFGKNAGKNSGK